MVIEISFPRGGRVPSQNIDKPIRQKKEYDLFGRSNDKAQPKTRAEKNKVKEIEEPLSKDIEAVSAELLTYRTIQDGMVLLGCIREVQKMTLGINLPGRLAGRVMITQISTPYTELLHKIVDDKEPDGYKSLKQIFTPGQCVAVKVVNMDGASEKYRIDLSMMPQDVNSQLSHSYIQVGMLLWGAITSIEDHGYVVDLGINGCRAFLKKVNTAQTYVQGEVGWFAVQKCDSTSITTTVELNSMPDKLETMKVIKDINLDHLLPGMKIDFTVSKRLFNGLEGKFLNDYTGYIHQSQFKTIDKMKKVRVEQNLDARVLYIMPVTKLTYLTVRDISTHERGNIADGTLTTCTVLSNAKGGLYVNLGNSDSIKGFVSFRRLKSQLAFNGDMDDFAVLRRDYPIRSKHKCRVLSYDYLEQVYICSLEKELTQKIAYSLKDLKVGEEVTATIKDIQPTGLLVAVDNAHCYIRNVHLSDVVLDSYANIKSKYKVGQTVKAKVWMINIKENNGQLTMKPSFLNLDANSVLKSYEQAKSNDQYLGVVKQISTNGLLIEFFGNIFGWVPKSEMSFERVASPEKMFKIGQVVKCTVLKKDAQRLTVSLQPPIAKTKKKSLRLGQHVDAMVTNITNSGIEVRVLDVKMPAVVPLLHICKFPDIAEKLAGTYKPGDKLNNLVCVNANSRIPVLSMRDTHLHEDNIPDLNTLQINTVLSCSIQSVTEKGMFVQAPIKDFNRFVIVPKNETSNIREVKSEHVKQNQYVLAKVLSVKKGKQPQKEVVEATVKLNKCWNFDLNESVERLHEYLSLIDKIRANLKTVENPLANLKIGEIVTGVVQEKNEDSSFIIDLKNGAKAIVQQEHIKEKLIVGNEVKGIVLWVDFVKNRAEISLCTKLITRVNKIQDGKINMAIGTDKENTIHAEVLLVKEEFALVVLRGKSCKRQIAFVPTRLHANDFFPDLRAFAVSDVVKIVISKKENGKIIALLKQLIQDTNKNKKQLLTPIIQLPDSEQIKQGVKNELNETKEVEETKEVDKTEEVEETEVVEEECTIKNKKAKKRKTSESSLNEEVTQDNKQTNKKSKKKKNLETCDETTTTNTDSENRAQKRKNFETSEEVVEEVKTKKKKKEKKQKTNVTEETKVEQRLNETVENANPILSGASNFWNVPSLQNAEEESSGDEDPDQDLLTKQQKKKKLTPAERAEAARIEEERIRKIETELADSEAAPKTADQFDRQLLANPNNSLLWINYMAFHLEATEIEKARAIARKALNTIEFREEQEKLNVWIAFLNLENRYGSNESFTALLDEAVQMNDALTVYLQALNILADSKKTAEFTELLTKVSKKFKQQFKMWTGAADACYKCDLKEQARNLMQRSLKSLDEKQHVNLLVQFAFMESRYNEPERAEALLEKVLASYPRRVDVWTSYVEMLIKSDRIQIARNVLERAAGQKLPARKMKTIFNKYIQFETKYGDEDKVNKVREIAAHYVKTALK